MQYIVEGILFGLTLTILLGPIFIVLIQTSLERGTRAGLIAGSGIWVSDLIIVYLSIIFVKNLSPYVHNKGFVFWMGLVGGIVLIGVGMGTILKKTNLDFSKRSFSPSSILSYWTKGFLVNTINPFTFIFWLTVTSSFVVTRQLNSLETFLFFGSIILTIIFTDSLKVLLAKLIRNRITEKSLSLINKIAGSALIIFGFILLLRSVL